MMGTTSDHQLAIDIGNTSVKAGVFLDGFLTGPVTRFTDQEWEVADRMVTNLGVKNIIYSTVANVPPAKWMDKWNQAGRFTLALKPELPLPFTSLYETPATLGQDRIAAVAGSLSLPTSSAPAAAPAEHLPARLIVDAGTCITLDLIDGDAVYYGGNISPGVRMRLRSMHDFTARLPLVEPGSLSGEVGRSTEKALLHGGQFGAAYEIEGLFLRLRETFPDLELILTGGDAALLAGLLSIPNVIYPNLVLHGLNQILSYYVQHQS
ncbi:type III pantothenate kinase [Neolewinella aurantiaca]|uniref:Type III pantothenate kinase n=1 Tax=Neolewinella aurantiaca TaxID=2602767 RepID=A0A5C7FE22_9BACT|nr:type III pantothenate kinase [Neolewinella aurantiaca]TXF88488.1 type III pantothenate kinase [Neolewinella aurantiaca]